MQTPELKPCPFCGSEQIIVRYGQIGTYSNVFMPRKMGYAYCRQCGARSNLYLAKNAVNAWNRRAGDET